MSSTASTALEGAWRSFSGTASGEACEEGALSEGGGADIVTFWVGDGGVYTAKNDTTEREDDDE